MKPFTRLSAVLSLVALLAVSAFAQTPVPTATGTPVKGYTKILKSGKAVAVKGYTRTAKPTPMTHVKSYMKTLKTGKMVKVKGYTRKPPVHGMMHGVAPKPTM